MKKCVSLIGEIQLIRDQAMKDTALVIKDNRLIEASYRLSLVEHRIMQMAIAWTRCNKIELDADTWIELHSSDYSNMYSLDEKISYRQLKAAARDLRERRLIVEGVHPETGDVVTIEGGWVSYVMYSPKKGTIGLQFSKIIIPYISTLEERFTSYQIKHVSRFSSTYAIRLYELCKQYLSIGKRFFKIQDLKDALEANEPSYDRIDNFKSKILDKSVDQINLTSDIDLSYFSEKQGRSIVGYTFLIKLKPQNNEALDSSKTQPLIIKAAPISFTTAERSMFKELNITHPEITTEMINDMCAIQQLDPLMVMIKLKQKK